MSFDATILGKFLHGDRRACARIISIVEDRRKGYEEYLEKLQSYMGRAYVIGITGPPGVGKSTLINRLAGEYLGAKKTAEIGAAEDSPMSVAVVAVDPSSPFTGGAVLGDRIRMGEISLNPRFYFRSMSNRGSLGGLSEAAPDVVRVLDAFGKDVIIVETVGTGQNEVDIMEACDTTVVVTMPGAGDDIQAQKAGILEIGNVLVINKSDRDGAERSLKELQSMLEMNPVKIEYETPIILAKSNIGEGMKELKDAIETHRAYLLKSGRFAELRRERNVRTLRRLLQRRVMEIIDSRFLGKDEYRAIENSVKDSEIGPHAGATAALEYINGQIRKLFDRSGK